jgi:N6-adenosine-specific RNA methylase IME4
MIAETVGPDGLDWPGAGLRRSASEISRLAADRQVIQPQAADRQVMQPQAGIGANVDLQPGPAGRARCIYADPPWTFAVRSPKGKGRSAESYYDTMSIGDIAGMPVSAWAADDAVLLLWVPDPNLPRAFEVIRAWGFEYKTVAFNWVKGTRYPDGSADRFFFGLGFWTRANPELCLLATRGRPKRVHADVPQLLIAPRREHSRKPDEAYERIERLVARRWGSTSYPGAEVGKSL